MVSLGLQFLHYYPISISILFDSKSNPLMHISIILLFAALYFVAIATFSALVGQYLVRRIIIILGRASLIIFILAFTIFVSAISLGKSHLLWFSLILCSLKVVEFNLTNPPPPPKKKKNIGGGGKLQQVFRSSTQSILEV